MTVKDIRDVVNINLLFDSQLEGYLQKRNLLKDFKEGKIKCIFCGKTITADNLAYIKPRENKKYDFICDDNDCMNKKDY